MSKYSHLFAIGFDIESEQEDASDVTPQMFRDALMQRIRELDQHDEWAEVLGPPEETDSL